MVRLNILRFPDPKLREKAKEVSSITPELEKLAQDMLKTMKSQNGVGLAAIQVARPVHLFVADTRLELSHSPEEEDFRYSPKGLKQELVKEIQQPLILFNTKILNRKGKVFYREGCLSFPSYYADVKRSETIEVQALNEKGEEICFKTDGLLSICIQHELDHLSGKLFIDHLSPIKAQRLREEIKKYGYPDLKSKSLKKEL